MEIINRIPRMMSVARELRAKTNRIGLVPTRGSLHEGHLSLMSRARELCDSVIVAIYVDSNISDDGATPVTDLPRDAELAFTRGVDFIFAPSAEDMFPAGFSTFVSVEGFSQKLEGANRPGYFRGTTTAVNKLLNIAQPHFAFFGRKEAQRIIIIRRMIGELGIDVEIVVCPTVREEDGLALSSSNANLSTEERKAAIVLRRALERCRSLATGGERDAARLIASMRSQIEAEPLARIDYVAITDAQHLDPIDVVPAASPSLVSLAVYIGATRLTDNIVLNGEL
ncbi:MAG TPA: pantoate--beta-alanine ligase [Blastocatellia bacterium]|nr:pantoate--beta-alanine ligase [Blastocatellia bacterium]